MRDQGEVHSAGVETAAYTACAPRADTTRTSEANDGSAPLVERTVLPPVANRSSPHDRVPVQPYTTRAATSVAAPSGLNNDAAPPITPIGQSDSTGSHGTLMISKGGLSKYLGPTAGTEWLKDVRLFCSRNSQKLTCAVRKS